MSIQVGGKTFRTLADRFTVDGRRVIKAYANGKLVYPQKGVHLHGSIDLDRAFSTDPGFVVYSVLDRTSGYGYRRKTTSGVGGNLRGSAEFDITLTVRAGGSSISGTRVEDAPTREELLSSGYPAGYAELVDGGPYSSGDETYRGPTRFKRLSEDKFVDYVSPHYNTGPTPVKAAFLPRRLFRADGRLTYSLPQTVYTPNLIEEDFDEINYVYKYRTLTCKAPSVAYDESQTKGDVTFSTEFSTQGKDATIKNPIFPNLTYPSGYQFYITESGVVEPQWTTPAWYVRVAFFPLNPILFLILNFQSTTNKIDKYFKFQEVTKFRDQEPQFGSELFADSSQINFSLYVPVTEVVIEQ